MSEKLLQRAGGLALMALLLFPAWLHAASPLHHAIQAGNTDLARLLVENGAEVGAIDSDGLAPLHLAAVQGERLLVELLLTSGADVDVRSAHGFTPLHLAVEGGFVEVAELLISYGADVNAAAPSEDGQPITPVYLSIELGRESLTPVLRRHGGR